MKVIVTGGRGFIGSNLCEDLLKNDWTDWEVYVIDDLSSGGHIPEKTGITYWTRSMEEGRLEVSAIGNFVQMVKPEVVFHMAAVPRVAYSVEHPIETWNSNIGSTVALLEAVRLYAPSCRIVNTSSSSIYGGAEELPTPESSPANPQSPYGIQKWYAEELCRTYAKLYNLDIVSLRYFNVFGKYSCYGGAYSTVLSAWLYHLYVDPKSIPFLEGDGTQTRDFCYVNNVTQANILAALYDKGKFQGEAFNIAQNKRYSLLDCKKLLEKISGRKLKLEERPPRVGDVKHTLARIKYANSVLEYVPSTDFEKQVKSMATWYETSYPKH